MTVSKGRDNPNPLLFTEFIRASCYQFLRVIKHDGSNPPPFSILHHGSSRLELHRCIRFRSQGKYLTGTRVIVHWYETVFATTDRSDRHVPSRSLWTSSSGSNAWAPSFERKALCFGERIGWTAIELRWVFRYAVQANPVQAPSAMSIFVFIQRWPILLCQSYRLIASDPSPVLKAIREYSPSCCRRSTLALSSSSATKSALFATRRFRSACVRTSLRHSSACRKGVREVASNTMSAPAAPSA